MLFGEYLPDQPALNNPGCTVAQNCIPYELGYKSYPSKQVYSDALTATCQGSFQTKDPGGVVYQYAGDTSKLYVLQSAVWTDVTRTSGGYNLLTDEQWDFTLYGNTVIAVQYYDNMQYLTLGGVNFQDITGPKARHVGTVNDFVMCGNIYDSTDGSQPNTVQWSAQGNGISWPTPGTDAATQVLSGKQELYVGGGVKGIVSGRNGVIIQENAIRIAQFVGGSTFFKFPLVAENVGTMVPGSVVSFGHLTFFIAKDGFKLFDGSTVHSIGNGKVDKTFIAEYDQDYYFKVSAAIDLENSLVMWAVPVTGHSGGTPNKIYVYNFNKGRWSFLSDTVEILTTSAVESLSIEDLDAIYGDLDSIPISLDSGQFVKGSPRVSAFFTDKKLYNYDATAMTATIETKEYELIPGRRAELYKSRPQIDGGTTTHTIGTRSLLSGTTSYGSALSLNSDGESQSRVNSKYFRHRLIITGGFTDAIGVEEMEFSEVGRR